MMQNTYMPPHSLMNFSATPDKEDLHLRFTLKLAASWGARLIQAGWTLSHHESACLLFYWLRLTDKCLNYTASKHLRIPTCCGPVAAQHCRLLQQFNSCSTADCWLFHSAQFNSTLFQWVDWTAEHNTAIQQIVQCGKCLRPMEFITQTGLFWSALGFSKNELSCLKYTNLQVP